MDVSVNPWRLHRAGLLNFWYYDDEEFDFADGRLLLRGSNGSGKSVTMQSLITVLLDGVKSPDRLDSFGSRSRRMEDYLLGEKEIVNRDERTGYLYLEYKRRDTEQYITTGMGLQARRNGGLDFWGFVITDNRRIKKDLFLYKEEISPDDGSGQRIPLTRGELERAIGNGGHVVRSQKDYMELVNRYVFGFETLEQYQELMKLLIQLRSPKLSKDFKPSVIYEILNESLPSLSEEELRPLSDTIESMERTKLQIEQLERDSQALGRLCRQYDLYNEYILVEKAELAQKSQQRLNRVEREATECAAKLEDNRRLLIAEERRRHELDQELSVLQQEKEELEQHDVFRAERQKQERERQLEQMTVAREEKDKQLTAKKRQENEADQLAKASEQQAEAAQVRTEELLQELTAVAAEAGFAGHTMLACAFSEANPAFSFTAWRQNTRQHLERIETVLEVLRNQTEARKRRTQLEEELGEERRMLDEYRAEHRRLEQKFTDGRDRLLEEFYAWHKEHATILPMEQDELRQIALAIGGLYEGYSWNEVKAPLEVAHGRRITAINQELGLTHSQIKQWEEQEQNLTRELTEWKNKLDPEPARLPDNQATYQLLTERNIPFVPFYAAVEFRQEVTPEMRERLEAALTEMGLLDALIVPRKRLGEIPADNTYGAVIHPKPQIMTATLADYLYPTPMEKQEVTIGDIDEVLRSVLVNSDAPWLEPEALMEPIPMVSVGDGVYRNGLTSGRAARRQSAVYIGKQARQEYRKQQIADLEAKLLAVGLEQEKLYGVANDLRNQLGRTEQAYQMFLEEREIHDIFNTKQAVATQITRQEERVEQFDRRLRDIATQLQQLREEVRTVSDGLPLAVNEEQFERARQAMGEYQPHLHQLEISWLEGTHHRSFAQQYRERQAEMASDVDGLRGELYTLDGEMHGLRLELTQINQRLQELGADELREHVRQLTERLDGIPREIRKATETVTRLETEIKLADVSFSKLQDKIKFYGQLNHCWQQVVEEELRLGLVYAAGQPFPEISQIAQRKSSKPERPDRTTVTERLIKNFHIENNVLMEYRMQLEPLSPWRENQPTFSENGDPDDGFAEEVEKLLEKAERQLITLDYEGRRQNPYQIRQLLETRIAEEREILSDQDKELYEEVIMNSIGRIISRRIHAAQQWVEDMNQLMRHRDNSSGLRFKLEWKARLAETEEELDTYDLVRLLHADPATLRETDLLKMMRHFQVRIERAKRASEGASGENTNAVTFQQAVREVLDYRLWFQFKLYYEQSGIAWRELTDKMFFKFSGGEKAMAMYIPLFSAAYSRYQEARPDAPYIITLDEAFAGVDENNIRDTFALVEQLGFNYIMNSQALWGDYDVVPALTIYELVRPKNAPYVTAVRYDWNGKTRTLRVENDLPETWVAAASEQ